MKKNTFLKRVAIVGLSAVCCLALAGCNSNGYTGGVAATVNGTEIQEDTVTQYIQDYRTSAGLESEEDWANWMISSNLDADTIRNQVIDYYVDLELVDQACEEKNVTIDSAKVDEELQAMKDNYSSDEEWQEALKSSGLTEEQYRESIEAGMKEAALTDAVVTEKDTKVKDSELLELLNTYSAMFANSKRSSHILFDANDEKTAKEVLKKIESGELEFDEAAKEYSKDSSAEKGGDVGWDSINSFVEEYTLALDELDKGEVSDLVTSDYGIHIIKCTDVFDPTGREDKLSDWPDDIVKYFRNILEDENKSEAYDAWLEKYKEDADISINDKPEGLPYDLDLSKYQPEEKNDGNADDQGSEGDNADGNDAEGNDADGDDAADDETVDVDAEDGSTEDGGENTDETIVVDEDGNEIDLDNLEVEDVTE